MLLTLLQQDTSQGQGGLGGIFWIFYIGLMLAMVYFMIIKPSKKQKKAQEDLRKSMEPGDSIMTTGGFYGTILDIAEDGTVIVEFGNNKNCRIPMHPNAIAEVEKAGSAVVKEDAASDKTEEKKEEVKLGKAKK